MLRLFVGQRDPPTLKDGRDDVNRGVTSRDQIDEYAIIDVERGGHCNSANQICAMNCASAVTRVKCVTLAVVPNDAKTARAEDGTFPFR